MAVTKPLNVFALIVPGSLRSSNVPTATFVAFRFVSFNPSPKNADAVTDAWLTTLAPAPVKANVPVIVSPIFNTFVESVPFTPLSPAPLPTNRPAVTVPLGMLIPDDSFKL